MHKILFYKKIKINIEKLIKKSINKCNQIEGNSTLFLKL